MSSPSRPNIESLDRDQQLQQDPSSKNYALSGKIMLSSIIILFVVVIFLVLLHLYARWYLLRLRRRNETRRTNRRTRIVFYADANNPSPAPTRGLDACVLKRLPLFIYSSEKHGDVTECAVCLSEFEEGETGRVLPKCKHSFHIECIDMWFCSHSTCPLCRSPVEAGELELTMPECLPQPGSSNSGTDTYHVETTSLADRRKGIDVRIDVPSRSELAGDTELRLVSPSQGFRSPGSRLLALKRIISMSRKSPVASPTSGVGPSFLSVTESDVESGIESTRIGTDEHR